MIFRRLNVQQEGALISLSRAVEGVGMKNVQAFITNIVFPRDYDEWEHRFLNGILYDIEDVLENEYNEWTVPKWCKRDDIVFFMFAKRSGQSLAHLRTVYKAERKDCYDSITQHRVENELERIRSLTDMYAGRIFAVGKVCGDVYSDTTDEVYRKHWNSRFYAGIDGIRILERPIDISEFKSFIYIGMGAITPVLGESFRELKHLIGAYNDMPSYLEEADATPIPLRSINRENWIEINYEYRHSYCLEIQFRSYYVDYLLPVLGDIRRIYSECVCVSDISKSARVDNVIRFFGQYLSVEVKLNVSAEQDLPGQCRQYCHLKKIELDRFVDGSECYQDYVLVIDTNCVYLYSYASHSISMLRSLDEIRCLADIELLREELRGILPVDEAKMKRRRRRNRERAVCS